MKIIARRVLSAYVEVDEQIVSSIKKGLLLYVGISVDDTFEIIDTLVQKITNIRIFETQNGECSVKDVCGEILSVSQFTLYGDVQKGRRPSFTKAMPSQKAIEFYHYFNQKLYEESQLNIQEGVFGADMKITAQDDGPYTLIFEK